MKGRLTTVLAFTVVLAAGALLGSALTQWRAGGGEEDVGPARDSARVQTTLGERVRVEVLNAGGRDGMAQRATDLLRARGFDVVYFGNADRFDARASRVVDRVGRIDAARAVADALGIGAVESERDQDLYLDVTVRLGSQWDPADAVPASAPADSAPWWDPRALLERARSVNR